jgi:hypothetical protein
MKEFIVIVVVGGLVALALGHALRQSYPARVIRAPQKFEQPGPAPTTPLEFRQIRQAAKQ